MNTVYTQNNIQTNRGFAMLFTVLIISIVLAISLGVSNIVFKQTILSGTARSSFEAFTQADRGVECGQYAETKIMRSSSTSFPATFDCGGTAFTLTPSPVGYSLNSALVSVNDPCFKVDVVYTPPVPAPGGGAPTPGVEITSHGYNRCDLTSDRTVERVFQVTF